MTVHPPHAQTGEAASQRQRERILDHDLPRNWDTMSVGALWDRLNDPRRRRDAPQSTYDALLFELSRHGVSRLAEANCQRRLADLSTTQLREMIAALMRLRSRHLAITDELLEKLGGQLP